MSHTIRIVIADDHAIVRRALVQFLGSKDDMTVIGEAPDGASVISIVETEQPDVVLMDYNMPEVNGVEATRLILRDCPDCRVLILSMHKDPVYVRETLRAGAKGYLLKDGIDGDLVRAVRAVASGEGFLSPSISGTVLQDYQRHVTDPLDLLTSREREVLQYLAEGKVAKEIAAALDVSVYTVDAHRSRIMKKLQLHSSGELVRFAMRKGLID